MADDKNKVGKQDRDRVSLGEDYEVADFARKHGMSAAEARKVIAGSGPMREDAEAAARRGSRK
ncbi:MAG: DUF3606 domain-containing protein [Devosia sp.]